MKTIVVFIAVLFPLCSHASEVTLKEFLSESWKQNPVADLSKLQDDVSDEFQQSSKGRYMPHLSAAAIDSTGFPGSTSTLKVGGLMGSPYRKGLGAGVIWDQLLYDFGRTSSLLKKVKADRDLVDAQFSREKYEFVAKVSNLYLSCARARTQIKDDAHLIQLAEMIARETSNMAGTGQKTLVDKSLTKIDVDDLKLEQSDLKTVQQQSLEEMKIYLAGQSPECLELSEDMQAQSFDEFKIKPPQVLLARAQHQNAEALQATAAAEQRPMLTATGSYGYLQDDRLVTKDDYSLGIGFTFPFYNGGEDKHKEAAYHLQAQAQDKEVQLALLEFRAHVEKLDSKIAQLKTDLQELGAQGKDAEKTTQLALRRYLHLQGTLVDVRESFKRLRSISLDREKVLEDLVGTSLERAVLDTSGI